MEIKFDKFDKKTSLDPQRKLFAECFPETIGTSIISKDHYLWKFHSFPDTPTSFEYKAQIENEIIGYYAAIPYHYSYEGNIMKAAMVCDVMTGVKARGKGVFTKLGIYSTNEFAKNGFDFTTGYPIRPEVIPGHIKAGWEQYFELPLYGRFIKFDSFLKKKNVGFIASVINFLFSIWTNIISFLFLPTSGNLVTETYTTEDIDNIDGLFAFYKKWQNETPISLIKDKDFLKWRLGAPETSYHIIIVRNQSVIVGVLIAKEVEKEGVPCMGILDLTLLKDYHKYANLLTIELIKTAKKSGSELLLVMMGKKWFKKYKLFFSSFLKTPYKFILIIKQLNPKIDAEILKNENNWHLMWIDSDDL